MKFAKKLQDELYSEWCEGYIDYKMMKKVLKQEGTESDEIVDAFVGAMEEQLHKVHSFMLGQQSTISEEIYNLATQGSLCCPTSTSAVAATSSSSTAVIQLSSVVQGISGHCTRLVDHIERFRHFALLNHMAIRKIIKKFDKRFQIKYLQNIGLPSTSKLLVSDRDIGRWLLDPAQHILTLMQDLMQVRQHRLPVERPLRQFTFWISELQTGSQLARQRVHYGENPDATEMRLRLLAGEPCDIEEMTDDTRLCVRNTFIDAQCREPPGRCVERRAASLPPERRSLAVVREEAEGCTSPHSSSDGSPQHDSAAAAAAAVVAAGLAVAAASRCMGHATSKGASPRPSPGPLRLRLSSGGTEDSLGRLCSYVSSQGSELEAEKKDADRPPAWHSRGRQVDLFPPSVGNDAAQPLYISTLLDGGLVPSPFAGCSGLAMDSALEASSQRIEACCTRAFSALLAPQWVEGPRAGGSASSAARPPQLGCRGRGRQRPLELAAALDYGAAAAASVAAAAACAAAAAAVAQASEGLGVFAPVGRGPAAVSSAAPSGRMAASGSGMARGRGLAAVAPATTDGCDASRSGPRWWTSLPDVCPISGFPVRLLPYPPFKLQVVQQATTVGKRHQVRLVDGCFLVLVVLSSWHFDALGTPLSNKDVEALDAYMRRCKLGPFRLGRALELAQLGTVESRKELEALRSRAERRLAVLRHVQQVRLDRGQDCGDEWPAAPLLSPAKMRYGAHSGYRLNPEDV